MIPIEEKQDMQFYLSTNGKDFFLKLLTRTVNRQRPNSARLISEDSYNRFEQKFLENAGRITVSSMRLVLETGEFEPYPEKLMTNKAEK